MGETAEMQRGKQMLSYSVSQREVVKRPNKVLTKKEVDDSPENMCFM